MNGFMVFPIKVGVLRKKILLKIFDKIFKDLLLTRSMNQLHSSNLNVPWPFVIQKMIRRHVNKVVLKNLPNPMNRKISPK